jgi:hypothetical protein
MPGMEGPEGKLHTHDYRLELVVESSELRGKGWVCDLDLLVAALAEIVGRIADQDLEIIRPQDAEAVTVEVFARCGGRTARRPGMGVVYRLRRLPGARRLNVGFDHDPRNRLGAITPTLLRGSQPRRHFQQLPVGRQATFGTVLPGEAFDDELASTSTHLRGE